MKKLLLITLPIILTAGTCFAKITKGPFLLCVGQNRAAVMWESDSPGPGKISYSKQVETTPEKIEYQLSQDPNSTKIVFLHKTWLEGLQPGKVYSYRITGGGSEGKTYSFRTQSADTDEVKFAVYGDCRTYPDRHRKIVELMIKQGVDFVVVTGDLVTRGERYEQWGPQFFEPLKGLAESVPVYAIKGNHDLSKQSYFEKLLVPPGQTANFSFDYGPVHYYCGDNYTASETELLSLIASDLNSSTQPWKFVGYHEPSLNFGGHWSDWGYPDALATLAKADADFVITGHSHLYERFRPLAPPAGTGGNFVTYITSGGGGAELYDTEPSIYHADMRKINHFCLFHIKGDKLTMDTIDIAGRVIDHLEITKTNGTLNEQYLLTAVPMEAVQMHQTSRRNKPAP